MLLQNNDLLNHRYQQTIAIFLLWEMYKSEPIGENPFAYVFFLALVSKNHMFFNLSECSGCMLVRTSVSESLISVVCCKCFFYFCSKNKKSRRTALLISVFRRWAIPNASSSIRWSIPLQSVSNSAMWVTSLMHGAFGYCAAVGMFDADVAR